MTLFGDHGIGPKRVDLSPSPKGVGGFTGSPIVSLSKKPVIASFGLPEPRSLSSYAKARWDNYFAGGGNSFKGIFWGIAAAGNEIAELARLPTRAIERNPHLGTMGKLSLSIALIMTGVLPALGVVWLTGKFISGSVKFFTPLDPDGYATLHQGGSLRLMEKRKQLVEGKIEISKISPFDFFAIYDPKNIDFPLLFNAISDPKVKGDYMNYLQKFCNIILNENGQIIELSGDT